MRGNIHLKPTFPILNGINDINIDDKGLIEWDDMTKTFQPFRYSAAF